MNEHRLEVADVFRQHGQEFLDRWGDVLSPQQRKAFRDIGACRTAALGEFVQQCDHCSHQVLEYKSCRNRHCPKCHRRARDQWLADRAEEILPVTYCHVIFTLPHELAPLALQNPRVVYGILFRAVAEALLEMAADPKRMGARMGFLAVLHTWSQRLEHHAHVHCVVPAGGLSPDGQRWISPRKKNFFLPVKPLSRLFRRKFLTYLKEAFDEGRLGFYGSLRELAHPVRFEDWVESLKQKEWVAHVKPPFGGPEQVLRYLARYTHRVAISNGRLLGLEEGRVRFRWRDSKDHNQIKEMSLDAVEFIRRFLLHVLPCGFVKIRHFGFLSNRNRRAMVEHCRELLPPWTAPPDIVERLRSGLSGLRGRTSPCNRIAPRGAITAEGDAAPNAAIGLFVENMIVAVRVLRRGKFRARGRGPRVSSRLLRTSKQLVTDLFPAAFSNAAHIIPPDASVQHLPDSGLLRSTPETNPHRPVQAA